ncbi:MAG: hypothetical protein Q9196_000965 [Gyalolechia fulgens]
MNFVENQTVHKMEHTFMTVMRHCRTFDNSTINYARSMWTVMSIVSEREHQYKPLFPVWDQKLEDKIKIKRDREYVWLAENGQLKLKIEDQGDLDVAVKLLMSSPRRESIVFVVMRKLEVEPRQNIPGE